MRKALLGELELEVLRFVSDHAPCTVREVTDAYGEPQGLARTTILTVMERLRNKGYLKRAKDGATFAYAPSHAKGEVMQEVVREFVENRLGGSLSPFVAYLAKAKGLTTNEIDTLRELVEDLDKEDGRGS
jgi:predicted transcriptional regulator